MSPKQKARYFQLWSAACTAQGWTTAAGRTSREIDALRHEQQAAAIGVKKSSKDLSNTEIDAVFARFEALAYPDNLNKQLHRQNQPKTRLLFVVEHQIKCLALFRQFPLSYAKTVLEKRFKTTFLEDLSADPQKRLARFCSPGSPEYIDDPELKMVRNTLARCLSRLREQYNREKRIDKTDYMTEHEMCMAVGVPCFRATTCAECRDLRVGRAPRLPIPAPSPEYHTEETTAGQPF